MYLLFHRLVTAFNCYAFQSFFLIACSSGFFSSKSVTSFALMLFSGTLYFLSKLFFQPGFLSLFMSCIGYSFPNNFRESTSKNNGSFINLKLNSSSKIS